MRLRTLKKWSKQAAPILVKHFRQEPFLAERGNNYHNLRISCHCKPTRRKTNFGGCEHQWHPLKGTPMVGGMSGYYEPEWEERTAWEELHERVLWGSKLNSMSELEWQAAMRVARVTAADQEKLGADLEEWARETAKATVAEDIRTKGSNTKEG